MSEENKSSVRRENFYVPFILPEWENYCNSDVPDEEKSKQQIQLTHKNAIEYAEKMSHVGWKRRVDYALKHLEDNYNKTQDSSLLPRLLENVISTVIVLASDGIVPDEYLLNSYVYLQKICNEFGENPPNIANFREFLKTKASQEVLSIMKSFDDSQSDRNRVPSRPSSKNE